MRHVRSLILLLAATVAGSGLLLANAAGAGAATPAVVQAASPAAASSQPRRRDARRSAGRLQRRAGARRPGRRRSLRAGGVRPGEPVLPPVPHGRAVGEALLAEPGVGQGGQVLAGIRRRDDRSRHPRSHDDPGDGDGRDRAEGLRHDARPVPPPRSPAAPELGAAEGAQRTGPADRRRQRHRPEPRHAGQARRATRRAPAAKSQSKEIPQPPGFRNAPPCSSYYGKKHRHDRSALRRRLPVAAALRAVRLRARRSCRAPTACPRRSPRASTAKA